MTENTTRKQHQGFQKGQSGNPAGRPKGSRNKINKMTLEALEKELQIRKAENNERPFHDLETKDLASALMKLQPKEIESEITVNDPQTVLKRLLEQGEDKQGELA